MCCHPFAGFASTVLPTSEKNVELSANPGACHQTCCPQPQSAPRRHRTRARSPTSFSSPPPADCRLWALAGLSTDLRAPITDSLRKRRAAWRVSFCTGPRKEKPPAAEKSRQMVSFTETATFFLFLSLFSVLLGHNRHIWRSREECAYIAWTLQGKCDARGRRGEGERSEYGRREDHLRPSGRDGLPDGHRPHVHGQGGPGEGRRCQGPHHQGGDPGPGRCRERGDARRDPRLQGRHHRRRQGRPAGAL